MRGIFDNDRLATWLVMEPRALETTTEYAPASVAVTLVKVFRCPMTKNSFPGAPKESFWLQAAGPVRNPYHGAAMLECGMEVK